MGLRGGQPLAQARSPGPARRRRASPAPARARARAAGQRDEGVERAGAGIELRRGAAQQIAARPPRASSSANGTRQTTHRARLPGRRHERAHDLAGEALARLHHGGCEARDAPAQARRVPAGSRRSRRDARRARARSAGVQRVVGGPRSSASRCRSGSARRSPRGRASPARDPHVARRGPARVRPSPSVPEALGPSSCCFSIWRARNSLFFTVPSGIALTSAISS